MDFLKNARDIAFLFAVFLYWMGWVYIYYFLDGFGLSTKAVDVDLYNILIYSSNVFIYIFQNQKLILFVLLIIAITSVFFKGFDVLLGKLFLILIIALFPLTFYMAKSAADHIASYTKENPAGLRSITFTFKDIKVSEKKEHQATEPLIMYNDTLQMRTLSQNKNGSFRLLVANKDEYYVLLYNTYYNKKFPNIYVIKKDMIEFATISN